MYIIILLDFIHAYNIFQLKPQCFGSYFTLPSSGGGTKPHCIESCGRESHNLGLRAQQSMILSSNLKTDVEPTSEALWLKLKIPTTEKVKQNTYICCVTLSSKAFKTDKVGIQIFHIYCMEVQTSINLKWQNANNIYVRHSILV
jgi:hypothetical protein